ncbi:3-alpha-hydroxycholanate dehydrogenase (NADP(+)) [Mycolicibacterium vanbaalenii]|uniref:3-alpha-hydroxycholanate dehydrogenase (NADP(+)) n=1 Tax=Mycolicibacterium vanbaalenii TaxID=110539 RepID=A0A5S9RAZ2_MYCVN|nr:SDR family NAD(P)-dependent oxidoreductase [Mycolicibacterium vanbaalenii]CAA0136709.1 3-alpha-hydroxycholanate dehydrogenase (NADP(+)) [Mycolicibacterium vanbaalenii]
MIDFSGKTVLVTGGGAGIGLSTVRRFAELGAAPAVLEVDADLASALRDELGPDSLVVQGDATDPADVAALAAAVGHRFGKLDILVNNVGHFVTRPTRFEKLSDEQIDDVYRVNLKHVFLVTRAMLPLLREGGQGASITTVSSIEGFRGIPGFAVYGAFKAAVTGFTMSLALELGPDGIRVNAVAPETTDTAQVPLDQMIHPTQRHNIPRWIPLGRFGAPDDIAGCVLFLASPLASWVSGTVVHADGGALAAAGWYRDDRGRWTNMPVIRGSSAAAADAGT